MRQLFSRLLIVALLLTACSGMVWGDNLTVTFTKKSGDKVTKEGQESLRKTFQEYELSELGEIEGIEVSGGEFLKYDWSWLQDNRENLSSLKEFVVTDGIVSVANIPKTEKYEPYFGNSLRVLRVAKLKKVGRNAFRSRTNLTSVSLPAATYIGEYAFRNCQSLYSLSLPVATGIDDNAFEWCENLNSVSLPEATIIGWDAFGKCKRLRYVSLPKASTIHINAFVNCYQLRNLKLGATPPTVWEETFYNCPGGTLIITDSKGVPLVGAALSKAANDYDEASTPLHDGKWRGWTIEKNPPSMLSVIVEPAGTGTAIIIRKADSVVLREGAELTRGNTLVIDTKPNSGYKHKKTTVIGANGNGNNEWVVNGESGEVVFTVVFEKTITLGASIISSAEGGTVSITRKDGGAEVKEGDTLTQGKRLVVTAQAKSGYKHKETKAVGADDKGDNEWEVKAEPGEQVIFIVAFEKKPEGEGGNNNNEPTPVESVLLAQARLFPNPTGGQVTVDAGSAVARCEVYSSTGALLQAIEWPESVFTIDLTASPSGVYLIRLVDMQGESKTLRVVKQ